MKWKAMMDDDGVVTLPSELIADLGWTPETRLKWVELDGAVALVAVFDGDEQ